jgi:hypothetical protein
MNIKSNPQSTPDPRDNAGFSLSAPGQAWTESRRQVRDDEVSDEKHAPNALEGIFSLYRGRQRLAARRGTGVPPGVCPNCKSEPTKSFRISETVRKTNLDEPKRTQAFI